VSCLAEADLWVNGEEHDCVAILLTGAIAGALLLLVLGPRPAPLGPATGDPAFAEQIAEALPDGGAGYPAVSAVRITGNDSVWAGFGDVTPESRFELGSITKTFTGLLLADATERGELQLTDRLDAYLPELAGTPVGEVTLEELASHRAGLPDLGHIDWLELIAEGMAGADYSAFREPDPERVIDDAAAQDLTGRGEWRYSNLGIALLGQAVTRAAGAPDWPALVGDRLLGPLGMTDTQISWDRPAPADLVQPSLSSGRPAAPWVGTGYGSAGLGVTTTAADLTRYAQALLNGSAPGMSALEDRWPMAYGQRIGLAWVTAEVDGRDIVWHNGRTGGSSSMLALDPENDAAVILLTNTARDVTGPGFALIGARGVLPEPPPFDMETIGWVVAGLVTAIAFAVGAARGRSRLSTVGAGLAAVGSLIMWWLAAPWDWAPPWSFGIALGLSFGALVVLLLRWSRVPLLPDRRRWLALAGLVLGALWCVAMLAFAIRVLTLQP